MVTSAVQDLPFLSMAYRACGRTAPSHSSPDMSLKQGIGHVINLASLRGYSPEFISKNLADLAYDGAVAYQQAIGDEAVLRKATRRKEAIQVLLGDLV